MKALTNILTHLLMLMLLMLVACTEETAEVDNLTRGEQYVQVRMHVPGMTAAATRADDGVIETIHALAFNADKELLATRTATNINNANENDGYNGTFNITVPNGTETIHFLANVGDYDFLSVKQESDLSKLSIGDWNMLRYWGKATTSDGNTTLNVTLYRNLAKISIKPSETDPEFNQFTQEQLKMTGFYNANERGALVPCKDGEFNFDDNSDYCTIPQDLTSANYELYSFTTMTAFEHENTDSNPTYVICKIGDYHYKVALADDEGNRYPIIRNHHYIIYVSDVDDYSHDDNYRADTYEKAFEKLPINLEVEVIELLDVTFSPTEQQTVQMGNTLSISMTVPTDRTLTNFSIVAEGFTFNTPNDTYEAGTTTFTFTPTSVGDKTITFTGQGENLNDVNTTIDVNVTASISANATTSTTLYYDSDDAQTVTVQVTVPAGVETLNIGGAENFTVVKIAGDGRLDGTTYTMGSERTATFTFTLNQENVTNEQVITFSGNNVTAESVTINMVQTPTVTFSPTNDQTIYLGGDPLTVTMTVPNDRTLTALSIAAEGFTVTSSNGVLSGPTNNVYTYAGGTTTFTFTPTSAGSRTIRFFGGQGVNIKVPEKEIVVTVEEAAVTTMSVTPATATINMDNGDTNVTFTLTKPTSVQGVSINIADINVTDLFTIAVSGNNTQYQNGNIVYDYGGNETIGIALTVKDNTIPADSYNVTFTGNYNGQNITATATIEVVNTPKLQYSYGGTTLYMKDSNGDANPTSLDVKVTVPDGSTLNSLTIAAPGFIVKNGEQQLVDGGTYTDNTERAANSTVIYTFTPKVDATDYTITFSSTDDDLIADKEISVTVKNENAPKEDVIWEETPVEIGWKENDVDHRFLLTDSRIENSSSICIVIDVTGNEHGQVQLQGYIPGYFGISGLTIGETDKHVIINTKQNNAEPDGSLILEGVGVTLKKIYIPTTE